MAAWHLYRHRNSDGSSKDWAVTTHSDGSTSTRWGKTASRLPGFNTRNGVRQSALEKQKLAKGYVFVAEVAIDDEGNVTHAEPIQPESLLSLLPSQPPVFALNWNIDCTAEHEVCVALGIAVRQLIGDIQSLQINTAMSDTEAKTKLDADQDWEGWQQLIDLTLNPEHFSQSGQIKPKQGITPWLFLMALKHKGFFKVEIDIATERSREVSTDLNAEQEVLDFFGTDLESVREAAEVLGLLKRKLNLASVMTDTLDCWF